MSVEIHKQSVVDRRATLGEGCVIGPYCTVGPNVVIGDNTTLISHVVVGGFTNIGSNCRVYPFVTLGIQSQDQKYVPGTKSYTDIGDNNEIREYVSIHSGTEADTTTVVGNDNALLAHAHVAHNCVLGNHVVMGHAATLAGHVTVGDHANLGGLCAVHQFCKIGSAAMVAGWARVTQDVLPFTTAEGHPAVMRVVNKIGMQRANYPSNAIADVRRAFRTLFLRELRLEVAIGEVEKLMGDRPHIRAMLEAIEKSTRGLARPDLGSLELNAGDDV